MLKIKGTTLRKHVDKVTQDGAAIDLGISQPKVSVMLSTDREVYVGKNKAGEVIGCEVIRFGNHDL